MAQAITQCEERSRTAEVALSTMWLQEQSYCACTLWWMWSTLAGKTTAKGWRQRQKQCWFIGIGFWIGALLSRTHTQTAWFD
eukprot:160812-Karenia_brevis.AAC.1